MADTPLTEEEMSIAESRFRGLSYRQIAKEHGFSYHKAFEVCRRPTVAAFIAQLSEDASGSLRQSVVAAAPAGVATLVEVARDKKAPPAARVSAARALVELGMPREPVRVVHTGDPAEPVHIQHAGQVLQQLGDGDLDALIARLTVDDSTGAR